MIQVDFTQETVEVTSDGEADGGIRVITGCDPSGQESVSRLDGDTKNELPFEAGARVRGMGISNYTVHERYLHEGGDYEILCQVRRGSQRKFLIAIAILGTHIIIDSRPESSPAWWIIEDDTKRQKAGEPLHIAMDIVDRKPIWDRLEGEDPV